MKKPSPAYPLKGIVFDLDGTLVDSLSHTLDAFNHAITSQGGRGHSPEEIMRFFGTGEPEIFAKLVGPDRAAQAYEAFRVYIDENIARMPLHAGVSELLETLKSSGIPISIFTGRGWDTTELILKHHRILDRFVTVVADDHVGHPKPSPEGLHLALSRMRFSPSDVLFVGDSPMDIQAAHAAGSQGVAALWDLLASREQLSRCSPHHWAENPATVWEIFSERASERASERG